MSKYYKILLAFLYVSCNLTAQSTTRDVPLYLENYHLYRWPQFLSDFYYGAKEILHEIKENISYIPESIYYAFIGRHPHTNEQAFVRFSEHDDICDQEKEFIKNRLPLVKKTLEHMLKMPIDENRIPKIGLVFSGGGFRAMLTTLGFLCGAEEIGLLDATLYCAGLSGSTWALAPWIASQKPLHEFCHHITHKLAFGIDHIDDPYEMSEMLEIMITKLLSKQVTSTIDIYGAIIANTLLKQVVKRPMLIKLSESHEYIKNGSHPMPIYTAIHANLPHYEWMEFTPFEAGSSFLKTYVPTWAYGRKFKEGVSVDQSPEQTLGYFMGVFGSAFEVNLKDIVRISAANLSYYGHQMPYFIAQALKKLLRLILDSFLGELRLFPSLMSNFAYLLPNTPIQQEKNIALIDAGIDFNLPIPPLLRTTRNLDIIIIYDASSNIQGAPELRKAEQYAHRKGLKFPPINYDIADKQVISVFKDTQDSSVPVVVYFPRIKNIQYCSEFDPDSCIENSYCNTFNFNYKPEEAKLLSGFAQFVVKEQEDIIKETFKQVLIEKYKYSQPESLLETTFPIV